MAVRLATVEDSAGIAGLVERYWEFESIGGFDRARIETPLGTLISTPERGLVRLQLQLGVDNHGARRFYDRGRSATLRGI